MVDDFVLLRTVRLTTKDCVMMFVVFAVLFALEKLTRGTPKTKRKMGYESTYPYGQNLEVKAALKYSNISSVHIMNMILLVWPKPKYKYMWFESRY